MFGKKSSDSWVRIANRIRNTTYKVGGLSSSVTYFFAIRAENSHGLSAPSQVSDPVSLSMVSCRFNYIFRFVHLSYFFVCMFLKRERTNDRHLLLVVMSCALCRLFISRCYFSLHHHSPPPQSSHQYRLPFFDRNFFFDHFMPFSPKLQAIESKTICYVKTKQRKRLLLYFGMEKLKEKK